LLEGAAREAREAMHLMEMDVSEMLVAFEVSVSARLENCPNSVGGVLF
jgi:hypothetical protein